MYVLTLLLGFPGANMRLFSLTGGPHSGVNKTVTGRVHEGGETEAGSAEWSSYERELGWSHRAGVKGTHSAPCHARISETDDATSHTALGSSAHQSSARQTETEIDRMFYTDDTETWIRDSLVRRVCYVRGYTGKSTGCESARENKQDTESRYTSH